MKKTIQQKAGMKYPNGYKPKFDVAKLIAYGFKPHPKNEIKITALELKDRKCFDSNRKEYLKDFTAVNGMFIKIVFQLNISDEVWHEDVELHTTYCGLMGWLNIQTHKELDTFIHFCTYSEKTK